MNESSLEFASLGAAAEAAAGRSHSPYSRFPVGAAVRDIDGKVYAGCNVENASLGLTQCAERNALATAVAAGAGPGTLDALVIYTPGERVHAPCGACRQVMAELMAPAAAVVSTCASGNSRAWVLEDLLLDPFTPESLLGSSGFVRRNEP